MEYPRKLYANVLLLDGKIINWKTGTKNWEESGWVSSSQPLFIFQNLENDLRSEVFKFTANNTNENNLFFEKTAKEFYKMFEISELYPDFMSKPYKD